MDTVWDPYARARVRIYEQTEEVMVPVTLTRQWAQIEYLDLRATSDPGEPVAPSGPGGSDGGEVTTPWVTLFVDQPVVTLERRPVERVRLRTTLVAGQVSIDEPLRHEAVVLETSEDGGAG